MAARMPDVYGSSTLTLREEDANGMVSLRVGDTLEVVLAGNPTTGYQWERESGDAGREAASESIFGQMRAVMST